MNMHISTVNCVLGHTGFVGATLIRKLPGALGFNSKNIAETQGAQFATVYCAAAPGSMFDANRFPERDAERINELISSLRQIQCDRFVLVSTIAVLDSFDGGYCESNTNFEAETPYGVNRRRLEVACLEQFSNCMIVRLPALFGPGLKKNFIFDLMNPLPTMLNVANFERLQNGLTSLLKLELERIYSPTENSDMLLIDRCLLAASQLRAQLEAEADTLGVNAVRFHNRKTTYQFYQMTQLVEDIDRALEAGLDTLHLAPAPLKTSDVYTALKGGEMPESNAAVHKEDMRTLHASLWNSSGDYYRSADDVLGALKAYCNHEMKV